MTVRAEGLTALFYTDCSDEDVAYARGRLVPQATAPLNTPVHVSAERWGRIPRVYIECLQDRTISPTAQKRMYTATPCAKVLSLNTGHSPFFAAPEALADHLLSLA
jgi:pimeloyl-ACP methyl ester carboxylesterase